jgi:Uroporphyrinogen decarboxylase (URO-D)
MKYTPRERMLAAYEGRFSDVVPVAPEFWYYVPARLMGMPMYQFELEVPHWKALQLTFNHNECEGWGIVAAGTPKDWFGKQESNTRRMDAKRFEVTNTIAVGGQRLTSRTIMDEREPSWLVERYIKDFDADWPIYAAATLIPPDELDWTVVQTALNAVGDDYLLEVFAGFPFVDFAGTQREGGLEQVIVDLMDREDYLRDIQQRHIQNVVETIHAAFEKLTARSVFIASSWSSLSLLSPAVWRKWEKPLLAAAIQAAHECGGLVHHHFHGKCTAILQDLADLGLDCICPFERPRGGDVTDLARVRKALAECTTFNGNVQTVDTLIRGTPADVRREVHEILDAFQGSARVIVGTGDQVGGETPEENIQAMIETARQFGKR